MVSPNLKTARKLRGKTFHNLSEREQMFVRASELTYIDMKGKVRIITDPTTLARHR